jgi:pyruvate dehydrogenase E2 component (dihydrolipoamide acetyltransferase)
MATDTHQGTMFAMPSLGADMTEGRITEWLVQPGDQVERGQIVVIVETDKSDIEVEVFEAATVVELLAGEGEMIAVGTPIARFADPGVDVGDEPPMPAEQPTPTSTDTTAASHVTSPMIRHLADELHVDPEHVHGTGPGGRVHRDDVEAASHTTQRPRITPRARRLMHERGIDPATVADQAYVSGDDVLSMTVAAQPERPTAETKPDETAPAPAQRPSRAETMRRHIAELMTRSWDEIPHFHITKLLDLASATDRLAVVNEQRALADRVVPGTLLLCAAARAAAKSQACNGWWRDGSFVPADDVRLGVVLSLRTGGILVPTIAGADKLSPADMMVRLAELVQRARQGRLRASDMDEATITVTSLGDRGADSVSGVIHPPQVAILGFGAIHDEVLPIDGTPTVRTVVHASLAGDHRAIDGLTGSRYLAQLQTLLDGSLLEEL